MARLHGAPVLGDSWMQDAAPTELIQGGVQREATGPHRKPPKGEPLARAGPGIKGQPIILEGKLFFNSPSALLIARGKYSFSNTG